MPLPNESHAKPFQSLKAFFESKRDERLPIPPKREVRAVKSVFIPTAPGTLNQVMQTPVPYDAGSGLQLQDVNKSLTLGKDTVIAQPVKELPGLREESEHNASTNLNMPAPAFPSAASLPQKGVSVPETESAREGIGRDTKTADSALPDFPIIAASPQASAVSKVYNDRHENSPIKDGRGPEVGVPPVTDKTQAKFSPFKSTSPYKSDLKAGPQTPASKGRPASSPAARSSNHNSPMSNSARPKSQGHMTTPKTPSTTDRHKAAPKSAQNGPSNNAKCKDDVSVLGSSCLPEACSKPRSGNFATPTTSSKSRGTRTPVSSVTKGAQTPKTSALVKASRKIKGTKSAAKDAKAPSPSTGMSGQVEPNSEVDTLVTDVESLSVGLPAQVNRERS